MKKVLIGKKTEIFIICSVLVLGAIFIIKVVDFMLQPLIDGCFHVNQNSSYEIFNTDEGKKFSKKTKNELIDYFKQHPNLKIKLGWYSVNNKYSAEDMLDKFDFVIDNFNEEDIQKIKDAYGINLLENSKIYSFEKEKDSKITWYSIKIKDVTDMDYYYNSNLYVKQIKLNEENADLDQFDKEVYPDRIKILVSTYCSNANDSVAFKKNIENLFNELAEKQ